MNNKIPIHLVWIAVLSILLFSNMTLMAQNATLISGRVVDSERRPLEYFSASLLNAQDSTLLRSGTFVDGYFEMECSKSDRVLLKVTSIGYHTRFLLVDLAKASAKEAVGEIVLQENVFGISEVVVTAKSPMIRQTNGSMVINVQGSSLSSAGDMMDLLKRSPGIIIDSKDQITVFGKGTPIIFIDDKEVKAPEELSSLQSSDIARIEIIRNPSAIYSAAGRAVLKIITKTAQKDSKAMMVYNNLTFGRRVSDAVGLQLSQRSSRFKTLMSLSFNNRKLKDFSNSYEINTLPEYIIENRGNLTDQYSFKRYSQFLGGSYRIDNRNSVGLQISGYQNGTESESENIQNIVKSNGTLPVERKINQDEESRKKLFTIDLAYNLNKDSLNSLSLNAGYAHQGVDAESRITEKNVTNQSTSRSQLESNGYYDIYSLRADYHPNITRLFTTTIGAKFSAVKNSGSSMLNNVETLAQVQAQQSSIRDNITSGYVQFAKSVSDFSLEAGVRYENTNSTVSTEDNEVRNSYSDFFPSVSISYEPSDKLSTNISYSRRISRPSFNQINPTIDYFDSLSYCVGNPFIRPTYINSVELSITAFDLITLTMGYEINNGQRVMTGVNDLQNPEIIKYTYFNIDRSTNKSLGVIVSKSFKFYSGNIESNINFPYTKIPFLNTTIINKKPTWYFAIRNEFTPAKNLTLLCNFDYTSSGDYDITHCFADNNLSLGAIYKINKPKIQFSIMWNNVLRSGGGNNWEDRYNTIVSGMRADSDDTWVRFGVRFNINTMKNPLSQKSATSAERDRL